MGVLLDKEDTVFTTEFPWSRGLPLRRARLQSCRRRDHLQEALASEGFQACSGGRLRAKAPCQHGPWGHDWSRRALPYSPAPESVFSERRPSAATKDLTAEAQGVRKNRSAGVSPACEPRQLLLRQEHFAGWKPTLHFLSRPRRKNGAGKTLSSAARNSGFI